MVVILQTFERALLVLYYVVLSLVSWLDSCVCLRSTDWVEGVGCKCGNQSIYPSVNQSIYICLPIYCIYRSIKPIYDRLDISVYLLYCIYPSVNQSINHHLQEGEHIIANTYLVARLCHVKSLEACVR